MEMLGLMNDFWSGKRVFLTGHTGFKGTWMSHWLCELGAKLTGFALDPPTTPSIYQLTRLEQRMNSIIGDIRDPSSIESALTEAQPDVVIHMAAQSLVIESYDNPIETYMTNVIGTGHVFEAIRKTPTVRAVVNVTTDKCYENKEWHWGYREHEAMGGYDPYSSSKGCSELLTASYNRSFFEPSGVRLASARAGNVIGGGDWAENRLVPDLIRAISENKPAIIRNPNSIRPWQHVLEPISGYLTLAQKLFEENGESYSGGWNFGPYDSDAKKVEWIADKLCEKWGGESSWRLDDPDYIPPHEAKYLKLDCSKARSELGWQPKLGLDSTLDWIVEWHKHQKENGDLQEKTVQQIQSYQNRMEAKY